MAKETVFKKQEKATAAGTTYIKAKELNDNKIKGVIAEGIFVGTVPNNFDETPDKSKPNIKIELAKPDLNGNKEVILNAAGNLNAQFRSVSVGTPVQVQYLGMEKITSKDPRKNGKSTHQFEVLVG
jgi:hypothetical protein